MAVPALVRHVDDAYSDFSDLFAAGEVVEALRNHPGWEHVQRVVELEVAAIDRQLDNPHPLEQATYAMAHGRRGGLRAMRDAADAIVERARKRYSEQQAKHESGAESPQEA
jgi:hypothetical protein